MYYVVKRDGTQVDFNITKISAAMIKAFEALNKQYLLKRTLLILLKLKAQK